MDVNTTTQFLLALQALNDRGISNYAICLETGIDRRNLMRLVNDPEHHFPRPQWLTLICQTYGVSPDYLILARGAMFSSRKGSAEK